MNICKNCICRKYCGDDDIRRCERYFRDVGIKKEPQTNEEWFCSLPTEEKAEVIAEKIKHAQLQYVPTYGTFTNSDWWEEWLKQPHKE